LDIAKFIFNDQKIAYFLTNPTLKITAVMGAAGVVSFSAVQPVEGTLLLEITPELIGMEDVLADILAGHLDRFELSWVNRHIPGKLTKVYLNIITLPHRTETGQIDGLVHIWQDVTEMGQINQLMAQHRNELRLTQDKLTKAYTDLEVGNAELMHLSNLKSMFVSFAAHELGSPLTSIMGYVDLLLDDVYGPLSDSQRECLQIIERSVSRLKTITSNLLVATKIETGHIEAVLRQTDLAQLVTDVVAELEPQIQAKSQHLVLHTAEPLPKALCDPNLAAQIIGNLVSNASKYTPKDGQIAIQVSCSHDAGFLQVAVQDNGIGIAPDEQNQLFTKFTRLHSADVTRASGTGLGLYITRSLIDLHGGRVWVESELNKGSKFTVTFPAAEDHA
jgi:signal transduction histidine kinase